MNIYMTTTDEGGEDEDGRGLEDARARDADAS